MLREITQQKEAYLFLLLLADPEKEMIERYLDKGRLFALDAQQQAIAVAVVVDCGDGECELKNLAVAEAWQNQGIGSKMIAELCKIFGDYQRMLVGTAGSSIQALHFYQKNGFVYHHTVANFFVDYYQRTIFENGVPCVDMIYLVKELAHD